MSTNSNHDAAQAASQKPSQEAPQPSQRSLNQKLRSFNRRLSNYKNAKERALSQFESEEKDKRFSSFLAYKLTMNVIHLHNWIHHGSIESPDEMKDRRENSGKLREFNGELDKDLETEFKNSKFFNLIREAGQKNRLTEVESFFMEELQENDAQLIDMAEAKKLRDIILKKDVELIKQLEIMIENQKKICQENREAEKSLPRKERSTSRKRSKSNRASKDAGEPDQTTEEKLKIVMKELSQRTGKITFAKNDYKKYSTLQREIDNLLRDVTRDCFRLKNKLQRKFENASESAQKSSRRRGRSSRPGRKNSRKSSTGSSQKDQDLGPQVF